MTHDQVEALSLADRVAVMNSGRILQEGAPADIYGRPNDLFVARFLGAANVIAGRVEARTDAGETRIALNCNGQTLTLRSECGPGDIVDIVLRPESLTMTATAPTDQVNTMAGTIVSLAFQGSSVEYEVDIGGLALRVLARAPPQFARGAMVWVSMELSGGSVFRREQG